MQKLFKNLKHLLLRLNNLIILNITLMIIFLILNMKLLFIYIHFNNIKLESFIID